MEVRNIPYSREEQVDGSASSACTLRNKHGWSSYQVGIQKCQFPVIFFVMYLQSNHKGVQKEFCAFTFIADDQRKLDMILSIIDKEEKQKGSSQVPGRKLDEGNLQFIHNIATKQNIEFKLNIDGHDLPMGADAACGFDDGDNHKQEFWIKPSEKLSFTEEEMKFPNNILDVRPFPELQRLNLADLHLPSFSLKIVWRHPELAQVKIDVIIKIVAYNPNGESKTTSVIYPVLFNNFGEQSFLSADKKRNRKAITQLSRIFEEARTVLEEESDTTNSIIEFLSDGEHLTADDVENLSKSKERASELLHHVLSHEDVIQGFLDALRSTGHPKSMQLMELITNPRPMD